MPLISCPDCQTEVSDKAVSCPKCGYPLAKMKAKEQFSSLGMKAVRGVQQAGSSIQKAVQVDEAKAVEFDVKTRRYFRWVLFKFPLVMLCFVACTYLAVMTLPSEQQILKDAPELYTEVYKFEGPADLDDMFSRDSFNEAALVLLLVSLWPIVPGLLMRHKIRFSRWLSIAALSLAEVFIAFGLLNPDFLVLRRICEVVPGPISLYPLPNLVLIVTVAFLLPVFAINLDWLIHLVKSPDLGAVFAKKKFSFE